MVGEHPTQTTLPGEDMKPAWRVARVAYRKVRQSRELDHPAVGLMAWSSELRIVETLSADLGSIPMPRPRCQSA